MIGSGVGLFEQRKFHGGDSHDSNMSDIMAVYSLLAGLQHDKHRGVRIATKWRLQAPASRNDLGFRKYHRTTQGIRTLLLVPRCLV